MNINKELAKAYAKQIELKRLYSQTEVIEKKLLPIKHRQTLVDKVERGEIKCQEVKSDTNPKGDRKSFLGEDLVKYLYEYYGL